MVTPDDTKSRDWRKKSARPPEAEDVEGADGSSERQSTDAPSAGTRLSAAEIHDNVLVAAKEEMRRPASELAWSSLAAGLTIGFSFLASAYLANRGGTQLAR